MTMKTLLAGAAAIGLATSASAVTVDVDPFDTLFGGTDNQITLNTGTTTAGPTVLSNGVTRSVEFTIVGNNSAGQSNSAQLEIANGQFTVSNQADVESSTELTYDVGSLFDQAVIDSNGAATGSLDILTVFADLTRILTLTVNGTEADSVVVQQQVGDSIGGNPVGPQQLTTSLNFDTDLLSGAGDDIITLSILGSAGLDYTIEILSANFENVPNVDVPAPGALGLLGLGVLGLGLARRRKAA
ncbi:MAG: PEP-CTERM sorting domain-containing protein [Pacificimonas sp.]